MTGTEDREPGQEEMLSIDLTDYIEPAAGSVPMPAVPRRSEPPPAPGAISERLPRPRWAFGGSEVLSDTGEWVNSGYLAAVEHELNMLRVRAEARRRHLAETQPPEPFDIGLLGDLLDLEAELPPRIEACLPGDAGMLLIAQRKAGKSTLSLNLSRSLVTGEPFVGSLAVRPIEATSRIGFLNFEVTGRTFARWADEVGVPRNRMVIVNLRGKRNPFTRDEDLAQLGAALRAHAVETLIVDPFSKAFAGCGDPNDNGAVESWLSKLDRFARSTVGARDVILTAHAGHQGEHVRGASTLEGWADSIVMLTRQNDTRYLSAEGRDVELSESALDYDPDTRRLLLRGGSRTETQYDHALGLIIRLLNDKGVAMSGREIETALGGVLERGTVRAALDHGHRVHRVMWSPAPRRAHPWSVLPESVEVSGDNAASD